MLFPQQVFSIQKLQESIDKFCSLFDIFIQTLWFDYNWISKRHINCICIFFSCFFKFVRIESIEIKKKKRFIKIKTLKVIVMIFSNIYFVVCVNRTWRRWSPTQSTRRSIRSVASRCCFLSSRSLTCRTIRLRPVRLNETQLFGKQTNKQYHICSNT